MKIKKVGQKGFAVFEIILVFIVVVLLTGTGWYVMNKSHKSSNGSLSSSKSSQQTSGVKIDPDNPPKFIQADFVELNKVFLISKFRSGDGHDFSQGSGETCRSMKHYFSTMDLTQPDYKQLGGMDKTKMPMPTIDKDAKIFSPVDGTLQVVNSESVQFNQELAVTVDKYPDIRVRMMHVQLAPGVKDGKVKAGQLIGLVLANQSFDMAIEDDQGNNGNKVSYISYFAAMPDNIFAKYQARGVKSRDDLIISKAYRDANPFSCKAGTEEFAQNYAYLSLQAEQENLVKLSGYDQMTQKQ